MVIDNAKWVRVFKIFERLSQRDKERAGALYHGTLKLHRDAHTEPCAEDIMETCLRALGHLAPELMMDGGALEYEDAMAGNEIIANLTSERN